MKELNVMLEVNDAYKFIAWMKSNDIEVTNTAACGDHKIVYGMFSPADVVAAEEFLNTL